MSIGNYMMNQKTLKMFANDTDTVIHYSLEEAKQLVYETHGYDQENSLDRECIEQMGWHEVPEDSIVPLRVDPGDDLWVCPNEPQFQSGYTIRKTAAEWCAEMGVCFFGSTEY